MYTHLVAERLGMSRRQFLKEHNSSDIAELMAFDRLKDEDYKGRLESEIMDKEVQTKQLIAMLGGSRGNN